VLITTCTASVLMSFHHSPTSSSPRVGVSSASVDALRLGPVAIPLSPYTLFFNCQCTMPLFLVASFVLLYIYVTPLRVDWPRRSLVIANSTLILHRPYASTLSLASLASSPVVRWPSSCSGKTQGPGGVFLFSSQLCNIAGFRALCHVHTLLPRNLFSYSSTFFD
jgi:hypothetical protein